MLRHAFLYLSHNPGLQSLAMHLPLARRLAYRFVAGTSRGEMLQVVRELDKLGILTTTDHLGENVTSAEEAQRAAHEYLLLLQDLKAAQLHSHVSVKLTQMGLDIRSSTLDRDLALSNVARIVDAARGLNAFTRIDMEGSQYTEVTLEIFRELAGRFGTRYVGPVIQAYLYRSLEDVRQLIQLGANVRLCKGAYDEPPSVAFPQKADVDINYVRLLELLFSPQSLQSGAFPAVATHDERMIAWAQRLAKEHLWPRDRFEFQMLYGVRRDLQLQLVRTGYRVRAYVPYGTHWYPYFMRRLAERPANALFLARNLLK
ncbi:MAG: proline dehydrogenase family protein [Chloroflexi bacterium]|nr:proline dehydrogenase family protein [Chloroflexota bacterium]